MLKPILPVLLVASAPAFAQSSIPRRSRKFAFLPPTFAESCFPKGFSKKLSAGGAAEAQLKGVLKKLADIGFEGSVNFDQDKYVGVLREDLVGELNDNRACRLLVWNDLKASVIQQSETPQVQPDAYRYAFT